MRRWLNDLLWSAMIGTLFSTLIVVANFFTSGWFHDWDHVRDPEFWKNNAAVFVISFVIVVVVIWADRRNRSQGVSGGPRLRPRHP